MHKEHNEDDPQKISSEQPNNQDVLSIVKRMQQQLAFLEKKIDQLLGQSGGGGYSGKPFMKDRQRNFSKPFRPFRHRDNREDRGGRPPRSGFRDRFRDKSPGQDSDNSGNRNFEGSRKPFRKRRDQ